ncbi:MAG: hypothetical protein H6942_07400 [Candidatus Accumulibacter sp.]|uniref:hypothetical protein n=1 Tax=Accumulibacter sp. TaxID=2053492 RepID=UPI0019FECC96|nr:hypothetical protein [Accumulibacter sp.]MBE2259964.1 hypothetical protein [Paracoccaceae bacterium]MCB1941364.1 hypothetical protein [Accumulibacter sp.]MCP5248351.1 hypothetical protein [Accumulibacter sp.]
MDGKNSAPSGDACCTSLRTKELWRLPGIIADFVDATERIRAPLAAPRAAESCTERNFAR